MSQVPRAVLEAETRANKLQEELIAQRKQQSEAPQGEAPQAPTPPVAETPPASNDSQPPALPEDWEHRFKVLQGKYNSEVPRYANDNKEMKSRLEVFERELEQLKAAPPTPLVTQDEIDEYGEGLIDVARRISREELAVKQTEIDALKRQMQTFSEASTNTAKGDFFKTLNALVPTWEQVNEDPAFIKWLGEFDDFAGETRQSLLGKAEASRDAARVGKFFASYLKTSSTWAANSQASLESQVVPSANRSPDTPPSKKIWQRSEISEFYNRMRRNEVSDADALAIEADINKASIEGRIR